MAGDPSWSNVALLMHFDGVAGSTSFTSTSANNLAITTQGSGSAISASQSKFGGTSLALTGAGNLVAPNSALFALGANDFTIECFIYRTVTANNGGLICKQRGVASYGEWAFTFDASTGKISFSATTGGEQSTSWNLVNFSGGAVPNGAESHVAVTRQGSTFFLFVGGALVATATASGAITAGTGGVSIGASKDDGSFRCPACYVDELRITNGVARYTAAFTPPTAPFADGMGQVSGTVKDSTGAAGARVVRAHRRDTSDLVAQRYTCAPDANIGATALVLHGDYLADWKGLTDMSLNPHAVTVVGNAKLVNTQGKFGRGSLYFDGVNSRLYTATSPDFGLSTGDFTVEAFVYLAVAGSSGNDRGLFDFRMTTGGTSGDGGTFFVDGPSGKLAFYNGTLAGASGTAVSVGAWHHVALSRTAGTTYCFLDGVLQWSTTLAIDFTTSRAVGIGGSNSSANPGTSLWNGYMNELRITKGLGRYSANFTPPTDRLPDATALAVGSYSFYTPTLDELTLVALDSATTGTIYDDVCERVIPA